MRCACDDDQRLSENILKQAWEFKNMKREKEA